MERLFLGAGLLALGYYGYIFADRWFYQKYEDWALNQNLEGKEASKTAYLEHILHPAGPESDVPNTPDPSREGTTEAVVPRDAQERPIGEDRTASPPLPSPKRQDKSLIGRIEIPRVGVSAIVREGVDDRTLRRAVGHVPGTALPGKPGNIGLAGHRDTFFVGLRNIRKSDRIRVRTLDGDFDYEVESMQIVTPKDVEVLQPTKEPALTLVTCYPFNYVGSAPKRYIVRARQVNASPGDLQEAQLEHRQSDKRLLSSSTTSGATSNGTSASSAAKPRSTAARADRHRSAVRNTATRVTKSQRT